ncbi:hypothetical protein C8J57DRAFT_1234294 [Mycena rebaudengoi]|nr:hypothetical protein C8J57DRAFT_1234294 [Mycena rebaudengoi]
MCFTILDAGSHLSILTLPDSILFAAYHIPPEGLSVHLRCTLRVMVFNLVRAATHDFQHGAHLPFYSAKELKELKFWVTRLMAHFALVARTYKSFTEGTAKGDLGWAVCSYTIPGEAFQMLQLMAFLAHHIGYDKTQGWNVDLSPVLLVPLFHAACRTMRTSNSTAEYPEYDHEGRLITPVVLPDVETPLVFSPTPGADSPVYSMNRMPMGGPASLADYWTDDYKHVKMPFVVRVPVYHGIPVFLYGAYFDVRLQGDQARPQIFCSTHVVILIVKSLDGCCPIIALFIPLSIVTRAAEYSLSFSVLVALFRVFDPVLRSTLIPIFAYLPLYPEELRRAARSRDRLFGRVWPQLASLMSSMEKQSSDDRSPCSPRSDMPCPFPIPVLVSKPISSVIDAPARVPISKASRPSSPSGSKNGGPTEESRSIFHYLPQDWTQTHPSSPHSPFIRALCSPVPLVNPTLEDFLIRIRALDRESLRIQDCLAVLEEDLLVPLPTTPPSANLSTEIAPFPSFDIPRPAHPELEEIQPTHSLDDATRIAEHNEKLEAEYSIARSDYEVLVRDHITRRTQYEEEERGKREHAAENEEQGGRVNPDEQLHSIQVEIQRLCVYATRLESCHVEATIWHGQLSAHLDNQRTATALFFEQARALVDLNRVRQSLGDSSVLPPCLLAAMEFLSEWRDLEDRVLLPLASLPAPIPGSSPRQTGFSRAPSPAEPRISKKKRKRVDGDESETGKPSRKRKRAENGALDEVQAKIDDFANLYAHRRASWNPICILAKEVQGKYLAVGPGCARCSEKELPCVSLFGEETKSPYFSNPELRGLMESFVVLIAFIVEIPPNIFPTVYLDLSDGVPPIITNQPKSFHARLATSGIDDNQNNPPAVPLKKKGKARARREPTPPSSDPKGEIGPKPSRSTRRVHEERPIRPASPPLASSSATRLEDLPQASPSSSVPLHQSSLFDVLGETAANPSSILNRSTEELFGHVCNFRVPPLVENGDEAAATNRLVARLLYIQWCHLDYERWAYFCAGGRFWAEYVDVIHPSRLDSDRYRVSRANNRRLPLLPIVPPVPGEDLWWRTTAANFHPEMGMNPEGPYFGFMDGLSHPHQYREFNGELRQWNPRELFRTFPTPRPYHMSRAIPVSFEHLFLPSPSQEFARAMTPVAPVIDGPLTGVFAPPDTDETADQFRSMSLRPTESSSPCPSPTTLKREVDNDLRGLTGKFDAEEGA